MRHRKTAWTSLLRVGLWLALWLMVLVLPGAAEAQDGVGPDSVAESLGQYEAQRGGLVALAIGLGLGLAAVGGALAQGRATAAALEGLSRNPGSYDKVFTPFILGMVLIESLVIYSLVISLIMLGSLG